MTFLTMQQELSDRLPAYDQTVTADATKLKRWLNMAQQFIAGSRVWPFTMATEIVQTIVDYTTGTMSTTAASTSVTASATITDSKANQYIKFSDSDDWYKITAHTGGTDALTISPAATTTNTVATYTIRKLHYVTATPFKTIIDMKQLVTPNNLRSINRVVAEQFLPLYYDAGEVIAYIMSVPDSSGNPQFSFLYSPDTVQNIMIRGIKVLPDMSADGDESFIPPQWHDAVINIAAYFGFTGLDDTRAEKERQIGMVRIQDMARTYSDDMGRVRIMQPVDNDTNSSLQWALPADFGPGLY